MMNYHQRKRDIRIKILFTNESNNLVLVVVLVEEDVELQNNGLLYTNECSKKRLYVELVELVDDVELN